MVKDADGQKVHITWKSMVMIWGIVVSTLLNTGTVIKSANDVRSWIYNSGMEAEKRHEETLSIVDQNKKLTEENAEILQRLTVLELKNQASIPKAESATDQHDVPKYVSCCLAGKPCKHGQIHCPPTSVSDDASPKGGS